MALELNYELCGSFVRVDPVISCRLCALVGKGTIDTEPEMVVKLFDLLGYKSLKFRLFSQVNSYLLLSILRLFRHIEFFVSSK